ncbi:MAG TPA: helix-hairpin-helix domain-containing protein [Edaphocola sp.]|nr:helix-hairpin-helix domain-containing protein [Edaphocola sp.]
MIELVDFNTLYKAGEKAAAKKTRRSRGGAKTATAASTTVAKAVETAAPVVATDDLAKIEGIGPKIAEALVNAGVVTFADLAGKTAEEVKAILDAVEGGHFNMADPTTWGQQAQLAADGNWDELSKLQDELKGGKEVE